MQDDLKERLREVVQNVEAAKRHVYGLPVAAIRSDTHGNKMALWCDNGMAGVGQVCVAVNVGEFPDDQLAAIAGLANTALSAAKYADQSIARIAALEAKLAEKDALLRECGEALGDIGVYGCGMLNQPAALNGPEEAWLRQRIHRMEQVARTTLAKIKDATDAD